MPIDSFGRFDLVFALSLAGNGFRIKSSNSKAWA